MNHSFEITIFNTQNPNKLQIPVPKISNGLKSNCNLEFENWNLFVICILLFGALFKLLPSLLYADVPDSPPVQNLQT
jgi:hypothetical protein